MELHRRCSRSNIPALVMLLLQLSVLLSGAAAGSIDKSETWVNVKELRADDIIPVMITLRTFTWDGVTILKVCTDDDLVMNPANPSTYQATLITSVEGEQHNVDIPGSICPEEPICAYFDCDGIYPFESYNPKTFDLEIMDTTDPVNFIAKSGEATFTTQPAASAGYKIMCNSTGASPLALYRMNDYNAMNCIEMMGFEPGSSVCYTLTVPSGHSCVDLGTDSDPAGVIVCEPYDASMATPITVLEDTLTDVSLFYDGAGSKSFSFVSSAVGAEIATISDAIIQVDGTPTVYRGSVNGTTYTDLHPNTDFYNLCVVGLPDDETTVVPLGVGYIQDINLNVYDTGVQLKYGFANLNPYSNYTVTATDGDEVSYLPVTLDCSAVPAGDICYGLFDVDEGSAGTLSVTFDGFETNKITTPYEQPR